MTNFKWLNYHFSNSKQPNYHENFGENSPEFHSTLYYIYPNQDPASAVRKLDKSY